MTSKKYSATIGAVLLIQNAACTGLPPPYVPSAHGYQNANYAPAHKKVGEAGEPAAEGRDYCAHVASSARSHALAQSRGGWILGISSVLMGAAGTIMTATEEDPSDARRYVNASLPIGAAALGLLAVAMFAREKDASVLAATATKGSAFPDKDDELAGNTCSTALSDWESSRSAANEQLLDKVKAQSEARQQDQQTITNQNKDIANKTQEIAEKNKELKDKNTELERLKKEQK